MKDLRDHQTLIKKTALAVGITLLEGAGATIIYLLNDILPLWMVMLLAILATCGAVLLIVWASEEDGA